MWRGDLSVLGWVQRERDRPREKLALRNMIALIPHFHVTVKSRGYIYLLLSAKKKERNNNKRKREKRELFSREIIVSFTYIIRKLSTKAL